MLAELARAIEKLGFADKHVGPHERGGCRGGGKNLQGGQGVG